MAFVKFNFLFSVQGEKEDNDRINLFEEDLDNCEYALANDASTSSTVDRDDERDPILISWQSSTANTKTDFI